MVRPEGFLGIVAYCSSTLLIEVEFQSNSKLTVWLFSPASLLSLPPQGSNYGASVPAQHVGGFWGSELLFLCLHSRHFNHWAISPVP